MIDFVDLIEQADEAVAYLRDARVVDADGIDCASVMVGAVANDVARFDDHDVALHAHLIADSYRLLAMANEQHVTGDQLAGVVDAAVQRVEQWRRDVTARDADQVAELLAALDAELDTRPEES